MKEEFQDFYKGLKEGRLRFSQKAYIFLFCLLLSTFFWFLSALSKNYISKLQIPLEYHSLSEDFVLEEEPLSELQISTRGNGFELLGEKLSIKRNEIRVDLTEARDLASSSYYILSSSFKNQIRDQLNASIELLSISPDTIWLETQKRVSKIVPIKLQSELSFANGFSQRGRIELSKDSIKVSGPANYIDTLSSISTKLLLAEKIKDSLSTQVELILDPKVKGLKVEVEQIEVLVPVEKFTEKSLEVPIRLELNEEGHSLRTFPDQVSVYLWVPLSRYNNLEVAMLTASVEWPDEELGQQKLKVSLKGIPSYASIIRVEPEEVEYIIKK